MSKVLSARVKNVLNGDTVVLVPPNSTAVPIPERTLTLSYVRSNDSFESREFVRHLLIGKVVKFNVLFKMPTTGKEFGDIITPTIPSLIEHLVERGLVKLKENINEESDFVNNLFTLEEKAKTKGEGLWKNSKPIELVTITEEVIARSAKLPITTIVEKVISGDRVIARLILNKHQHVSTPLLLAGIKCPRTDDASQTKLLTTTAFQAKQYVEGKFLTKDQIKVKLVGENQSGLPIGLLLHPSGNDISEKLLENGFAEIVDWQSSLIGSSIMSGYRIAEQTAKALGKGLYTTSKTISSGPVAGKVSTKTLRPGMTVDNVVVTRVNQADTLVIKLPSNEEITVGLASLRAPKPSDTTITSNKPLQAAIANSAREFVRQQVAGKSVSLYIDGHRAADSERGFDARYLVSVRAGNKDLSEAIVSHGWAGVIKHNKQTSNERSTNWDKLIELEEEQKKLGKNGIYYKGDITKIITVGVRIVDASESAQRARSHLNTFKQKGRISGSYHVEYVNSANRVRLFNPKEGLRLTLILGGLTNERSEFAEEGLKFLNSKILQRNIEFEVYDMDKIGGFIGNIYLNGNSTKPIQVNLLEQGFVRIHDLAVSSNPFEKDFIAAEDSAKASKKGIWSKEQTQQVTDSLSKVDISQAGPTFMDIEVTYIDPAGVIYFQKLDNASVTQFKAFKQEFDEFHSQPASATSASSDLPFNLTKAPKKNDLVSVKLDDNGKYYRGRVLGYEKATGLYEVKHIDYAFGHSFKLKYVKLAPEKPVDYLSASLDLLDELTLDKTLVIQAWPSKDTVEFDAVLYSYQNQTSTSITKKLVEEGLAVVDEAQKSTDEEYRDLLTSQATATANRKGCWEYGQVAFDEEEF